MSPEAQRIAIAEVCGWHIKLSPSGSFLLFCRPGEETGVCCGKHLTKRDIFILGFGQDDCGPGYVIPDYLNDLNAMHEAELLLDSTCLQSYMENLVVACLGDSASGDGSIEEQWIVCHASASLRAKAFLQTWGKWHE